MNVPPLILNNYFTILKGVAILNTPYDQNDKVGSWLDCAIRCPVTSGCAAVNYNSTESTCYFYDWSSVSFEMISGKEQTSMAVNTEALSKPVVVVFSAIVVVAFCFFQKHKIVESILRTHQLFLTSYFFC